ncbi:MAG: 50S ribosomal protein L18, partial [Bdellovibrionales bacterium]|nr:50S ribosomal protein L18 [Bdellovibrionales bacterium]
MDIAKQRRAAREKRKMRVRRKLRGTDMRPRLCVYRSLKATYAQLVSDQTGRVLVSSSTRDIGVEGSPKSVES